MLPQHSDITMPTALRIANWDARHESAHSRKCSGPLGWVRVDVDMGGLTTRRILREPDGPAIIGTWLAILCWCADHPAGKRGWLVSAGEALDADGLALVTGWPVEAVRRALDVLTRNDIRWIEEADATDIVRDGCGIVAGQHPAGVPQLRDDVPQVRDGCGTLRDGCGTRGEERREEESVRATPSHSAGAPAHGGGGGRTKKEPSSGYVSQRPPSPEEWLAYAATLTPPMPEHEATGARDHYVANGWRVGKAQTPARDWKALVRTCHRNWLDRAPAARRSAQEPLLLSPQARDGSW